MRAKQAFQTWYLPANGRLDFFFLRAPFTVPPQGRLGLLFGPPSSSVESQELFLPAAEIGVISEGSDRN